MAKISTEITVPIKHQDEEVPIVLRWPTTEEMNIYLARKAEYTAGSDGKKLRTCQPEARQELFDKIVKSVENLEDDKGRVTADTPERIPANWKNLIIEHYIDTVTINVKIG